jgi:hypothetical protein
MSLSSSTTSNVHNKFSVPMNKPDLLSLTAENNALDIELSLHLDLSLGSSI